MAKTRITQERILSAAVEVLRKNGEVGLNVRSIAKELNCSTQPIYSEFVNMEALKDALCSEAKKRQAAWVAAYEKTDLPSVYKAQGMGFVRFAKEEKELFRFLHLKPMNGWQSNAKEEDNSDKINELVALFGFLPEAAKCAVERMSVFSFGLAVLQNRGADYSDEIVSELLSEQFRLLKNEYLEKPKQI